VGGHFGESGVGAEALADPPRHLPNPTHLDPEGSRRVVAPEEKDARPFEAVSASGECFAFRRKVAGTDRDEVVVELTETGDLLRSVPSYPERDRRCLALSPNGERLAIVYSDGFVEIWELPRP
jgi:hypothetical protein